MDRYILSLLLIFLISSLSFSRFYPVVCTGGAGMSFKYDSVHKRIILRAEPASQGADYATPPPGKCAWKDRPMTRPGETTRDGKLIFEIAVAQEGVTVSVSRYGTSMYFRDRYAQRIWDGFNSGRTFIFQAERRGEGVYRGKGIISARRAPDRRDFRDNRTNRPVSVEITLRRIKVHDDGDNVSPGDWKIYMVGIKGDRRYVTSNEPTSVRQSLRVVQWPSRGSKNVNSGRSYSPGLTYYLHDVKPDDWISLTILTVDCDTNGPLAIRNLSDLLPIYMVERTIRSITRTQRCSGEEIYEASGAHDRVAKTIVLPPRDWQNRRELVYRISGDGISFTAYLSIRVLR